MDVTMPATAAPTQEYRPAPAAILQFPIEISPLGSVRAFQVTTTQESQFAWRARILA